MKLLFLVALCIVSSEIIASEKKSTPQKLTQAQRQEAMRKSIERKGGLLYRKPVGSVAIFNYNEAVPSNDIPYYAMLAKGRVLEIPFVLNQAKDIFDITKASKILKQSGSNAAVFIIDDSTLPMSLVALESFWGIVNVAALKSDNPTPEKLSARCDRLFSRVCTILLGGGCQDFNYSAMKPVFTLADLDECGRYIVPMQLTPMSSYVEKLGIKFGRFFTYQQACIQGWAPPPTNKVQKIIWDRVHSTPKNPMKIEFDPKKGR